MAWPLIFSVHSRALNSGRVSSQTLPSRAISFAKLTIRGSGTSLLSNVNLVPLPSTRTLGVETRSAALAATGEEAATVSGGDIVVGASIGTGNDVAILRGDDGGDDEGTLLRMHGGADQWTELAVTVAGD